MSSWTRAFGAIIADIRQRVVEEPYFGKAVTPRATSITIGSGEQSPGQGLGWFDRHFATDTARPTAAPERDIHGNERGMER